MRALASARPGVRARPGRHRQDLPRRRPAVALLTAAGRPHHPVAAGGRGRRAARASCPATCARRSIPICGRSTTRLHDMLPGGQGGAPSSRAARSRSRRSPSCAAARWRMPSSSSTKRRTRRRVQMKMFLTRLGENSRMVVTGDPTQVDLPTGHDLRAGRRRAKLDRIDGSRSSASPTPTWCAIRWSTRSSRPTTGSRPARPSASSTMRAADHQLSRGAHRRRTGPGLRHLMRRDGPDGRRDHRRAGLAAVGADRRAALWPSHRATSAAPRRPPAGGRRGRLRARRRRDWCAGSTATGAAAGQADQRALLPGRGLDPDRTPPAPGPGPVLLGDVVARRRDGRRRGRGRGQAAGRSSPPSGRPRHAAPSRLRPSGRRAGARAMEALERGDLAGLGIADPYAREPGADAADGCAAEAGARGAPAAGRDSQVSLLHGLLPRLRILAERRNGDGLAARHARRADRGARGGDTERSTGSAEDERSCCSTSSASASFTVYDVMVPRADIKAVPVTATSSRRSTIMREGMHTRACRSIASRSTTCSAWSISRTCSPSWRRRRR